MTVEFTEAELELLRKILGFVDGAEIDGGSTMSRRTSDPQTYACSKRWW